MELCRANHVHQILSQAQLQRTVNNEQVSQFNSNSHFYDSPNDFLNFHQCAFPLSTAIIVQPKAIFHSLFNKFETSATPEELYNLRKRLLSFGTYMRRAHLYLKERESQNSNRY